MVELVHGRLFADHVDVSLLFWIELSVLFLLRAVESGRWRDMIVCGVAQGCAYLSKSYLALIVTGLSVVALASAGSGGAGASEAVRSGCSISQRHSRILGAALVTIAPWTIYASSTTGTSSSTSTPRGGTISRGSGRTGAPRGSGSSSTTSRTCTGCFLVPVAVAAFALVVPAIPREELRAPLPARVGGRACSCRT